MLDTVGLHTSFGSNGTKKSTVLYVPRLWGLGSVRFKYCHIVDKKAKPILFVYPLIRVSLLTGE